MCGRVVNALQPSTLLTIARSKNFRNQETYRQSNNIAPSRNVPVVFRSCKESKENELEAMKFGMKNTLQVDVINARAETIKTMPLFRGLIENYNRCGVN